MRASKTANEKHAAEKLSPPDRRPADETRPAAEPLVASLPLSPGKSHLRFGHYHKLIRQPICVISEQPTQGLYFRRGALIIKAQKNHSMMRVPLTMNLLPEVLAIRCQNRVLLLSFLEDGVIVSTTCFLVYGEDLVSTLTQPFCNSRSRALIHEETHLRLLHGQRHELRVFQSFGCKQKARPNVLVREAFVLL